MTEAATVAFTRAVVNALSRTLAAAHCAPLVVLDGSSTEARGTLDGAAVVLVLEPDQSLLERVAAVGISQRFAARAHSAPHGVPKGDGRPFALFDRFDPASVGPAPEHFSVLAIVTTYNEEEILEGLLDRLGSDHIAVHVIDNWSTDDTLAILEHRAQNAAPGTFSYERFPRGGPPPHFELSSLLERVEHVAEHSSADWIIHHDADEIREAPWPGVSLRDALYVLDTFGFTCADHTIANFVPLDDDFARGQDPASHFTFFEFGHAPGHFLQEKAWKRHDGHVELAASGGHEVIFSGKRIFPYKFLTRHYPIRSDAHGRRKIHTERRGRFSPAELARGWHAHYDELDDTASFVRADPTGLARLADLDGPLLLQRLTGAGLAGNPFPGEGPEPQEELASATPPRPPVTDEFVLRIQTVLFDQRPEHLARYLRTLGQAVVELRRQRPGIAVDIAFGDCSQEPVYPGDSIEHARWSLTGTGTRALYYEHFGENLGHGGAQNRLFRLHDAPDALLVLNPDTAASPRLLTGLLDAMSEEVGIVEARQLPLEHQKAYDHESGDTSWASGACSLVRGELFAALDGFDDATFFLYCDDVDLSWRARLAGWAVRYEPSAVVFHDRVLSSAAAEMPSATEVFHSGLASLLLPWKYSRADLADAHVRDFATSPDPVHHRVAAAFEERRRAGNLPEPIDPDHDVGYFATGAYAPLRFDYAR